MPQRFFLIGADVVGSPSPRMMKAAFSSERLDAEYSALSVRPDDLPRELDRLMDSGVQGMNVTIPFKRSVMPFLHGFDETVARVGAVNTVNREASGYIGHNTDVDGIVGPIKTSLGASAGEEALVLGAGGASRAFVESMSRLGCKAVTAVVRNTSRAAGFLSDMTGSYPDMSIRVVSWTDLEATAGNYWVVFNATPLAVAPPAGVERAISRETVVFDAVYRPVETELLRLAKMRGCRMVYGHEMLLRQGAAAFEIWTGRRAPVSIMQKALLEELGEDSP